MSSLFRVSPDQTRNDEWQKLPKREDVDVEMNLITTYKQLDSELRDIRKTYTHVFEYLTFYN